MFSNLALCSVVGAVGVAVSFSARDSLLGASGDLQTSSEYEDLERERAEEVEMSLPKVQQLSKAEEMGDAVPASGKERSRKKGKGKKKNKVSSQAHTPSQRHHTHTTIEDLCFTSHRDFCIHGHCQFMEDLREPSCICQKGYEGKRCAVQLMKTGHREVDADVEAYAHTALLVIAVMLSIISCSALLLTICVHYKTQRRFQAVFFNPSNEKENPLKNDMMI
ncbi:proheparin-binding EGF-like growth factor [Clupea harengus]|uniref:Proheparin-binding EGF-like growth factor n=1 Tax=Clupea harengus TaxID=7950 RepID=A0A6P3VN54_CLUHA|nr:proheparin-binding EGF-like growth factor [Clupea harengus]